MDNKQALSFILKTDQLLNDMGNASRITNGNAKRKELKIIYIEKSKMQSVCYDPFLYAEKPLGSDAVYYTCLVCGKVIGGTTPSHVVNLTEDGLIEGDDIKEFAVNQLKMYLAIKPPLNEAEIREALRSDIIGYVKQR